MHAFADILQVLDSPDLPLPILKFGVRLWWYLPSTITFVCTCVHSVFWLADLHLDFSSSRISIRLDVRYKIHSLTIIHWHRCSLVASFQLFAGAWKCHHTSNWKLAAFGNMC